VEIQGRRRSRTLKLCVHGPDSTDSASMAALYGHENLKEAFEDNLASLGKVGHSCCERRRRWVQVQYSAAVRQSKRTSRSCHINS
jgi:hypothetical protein